MWQLLRIISDEDGESNEVWNGKWFPKKPGDPDPDLAINSNNIIPHGVKNGQWPWPRKWFPKKPPSREGFSEGSSVKKQLPMGILDPACDDTKVKFISRC